MYRHSETRHLPYTPEQIFDLIADVPRYPEFLPWVVGVRIRSKSDTMLVADMIVGFKMLREAFTSKVTLERPHRIHVDYVEGPLKYLHNDWRIRPGEGGGSEIDFDVAFEFRSKMFEKLAGTVFSEAVRRMAAAFEKRAAALYGAPAEPEGSSSSSAQSTA